MQHLALLGEHGEERVVATDVGVAVALGALLVEAVGLQHRGVEVDRDLLGVGSGAGIPGSLQQVLQDGVQLPRMARAERAQKGPNRGRCHHRVPEHHLRVALAERVDVLDAITTAEQ